MFQLTAARRRLGKQNRPYCTVHLFQLTAARRRLENTMAAAYHRQICFNSQPPEGGWQNGLLAPVYDGVFQLTAARRRLGLSLKAWVATWQFQLTAARRRLG